MKHHTKQGSAILVVLLVTSIVMVICLSMQHIGVHMTTIALERQKQMSYYYLTKALLEYGKCHLSDISQMNLAELKEKEIFFGNWPLSTQSDHLQGRLILIQKSGTCLLCAQLEKTAHVIHQLYAQV